MTDGKEVYSISNNVLNYQQARLKCRELGASLASREQLQQAQKNGAEWCNYGWAKNKEAYYPMQTKVDGCGEIGLNGGPFYEEIRIGANCYGKKPAFSAESIALGIAPFNRKEWSYIDSKSGSDE